MIPLLGVLLIYPFGRTRNVGRGTGRAVIQYYLSSTYIAQLMTLLLIDIMNSQNILNHLTDT
jgi:hypothetical protein